MLSFEFSMPFILSKFCLLVDVMGVGKGGGQRKEEINFSKFFGIMPCFQMINDFL